MPDIAYSKIVVAAVTIAAPTASQSTGTDASKAVQITAFEGALPIDKVHFYVTFILEEPVVDQMKRRQHGRLLFGFQLARDIHCEHVGVRNELFCELAETIGSFLDNLSHAVALGVLDLEGVITTNSSNAASGIGLDGGNIITITIHHLQRGRQPFSSFCSWQVLSPWLQFHTSV